MRWSMSASPGGVRRAISMASRAPAAIRVALVGEGYHVGRAACIGDCLVLQEAQRFEPVEVRSASALAAVRWEVVTRYDPERSDRRERAGFPGVQHVVAISGLDAFALGPGAEAPSPPAARWVEPPRPDRVGPRGPRRGRRARRSQVDCRSVRETCGVHAPGEVCRRTGPEPTGTDQPSRSRRGPCPRPDR